jgi:hypothetical protein
MWGQIFVTLIGLSKLPITSASNGKIQLAFFRSSNILANYNFPLIAALYVQGRFAHEFTV